MRTQPHKIIRKYLASNYSVRIQKEFVSWLKNADGAEEKKRAFKSEWDKLDSPADESTIKSFESLQLRIHISELNKKRKKLYSKLLQAAAILLLPLLSATLTYYRMSNEAPMIIETKLVECIVPNGETRTILLPDSSIVKVNSGSVLIYPDKFSGQRDVYLNGEAYFNVRKDETKPFVVKTTDMDIEVMGTVFNISAYTDSEGSSTTLESGKVNVKLKAEKISMTLSPNEQVLYNRISGEIEKRIVETTDFTAWINNHLVIKGMSIYEIVKIMERKYAVKVYLESNKYKNEKITIKISKEESIEDIIKVLQHLIPQLTYKMEKDRLYIY